MSGSLPDELPSRDGMARRKLQGHCPSILSGPEAPLGHAFTLVAVDATGALEDDFEAVDEPEFAGCDYWAFVAGARVQGEIWLARCEGGDFAVE